MEWNFKKDDGAGNFRDGGGGGGEINLIL